MKKMLKGSFVIISEKWLETSSGQRLSNLRPIGKKFCLRQGILTEPIYNRQKPQILKGAFKYQLTPF